MLYEIRNVRQRKGEGLRRWFTDDFWDLFTWSDELGSIVRFQLAYGKPNAEACLIWDAEEGFSHAKISSGEQIAGINRSPILLRGGTFDSGLITERLRNESSEIDGTVSSFVLSVLQRLSE